LKQTNTVAFLVIKNDVLLYEGYFNGFDHNTTVTSFSVAKSFVSALVGIAISEDYIGSVEDPITKYVPELIGKDPRYQNITLRQLLTMSSGIRYNEQRLPWSDDAAIYYAPDLRAGAISSKIVGSPGQTFHYNNFHPLLLGLVLERTRVKSTNQHQACSPTKLFTGFAVPGHHDSCPRWCKRASGKVIISCPPVMVNALISFQLYTDQSR
jgi:CubicO group peptidase (beta-lactamase class C family)